LQSADFFYNRGIAEHALGKRDLAVADYTRALAKRPASRLAAQVHNNRAAAYAADRNYRAAVLDYDAAIEADPRNGPVYLRRATARRRADDARGALADLDRATELGVDRKLVTRERAEVDWDLGRYDEAAAGFTALLEQSPSAPAYECRGVIEFSLGEYDKAAQDFSAYFKTANARPLDYVEFFRLLNRRAQKSTDQEAPFLTTLATWPDGWPKTLGRYLAGQITEGRLLDEANGSPAESRDERLCEAYGYIGLTYLLAGDMPTAEDFLQKCVRTGVINFYEYRIARAELRRMHATY
jgi:lipoprotein NlpI